MLALSPSDVPCSLQDVATVMTLISESDSVKSIEVAITVEIVENALQAAMGNTSVSSASHHHTLWVISTS